MPRRTPEENARFNAIRTSLPACISNTKCWQAVDAQATAFRHFMHPDPTGEHAANRADGKKRQEEAA